MVFISIRSKIIIAFCFLWLALPGRAQAPPLVSDPLPLANPDISSLQSKAQAGDTAAMFALAQAHQTGIGVARDPKAAADWYRKAADAGDTAAMRHLAFLYSAGEGVTADPKQAIDLLQKAADKGDPLAEANLAALYTSGAPGLPRNQELALKWVTAAAQQGNRSAQMALGKMYLDGTGVERDRAQALQWFQKSAEQNYPQAQTQLARMYADGIGVTPDLEKAADLYGKAADADYAPAEAALGRLYAEGKGVKADPALAVKWLLAAEGSGDARASTLLRELSAKLSPEQLDAIKKELPEWRFQRLQRLAESGDVSAEVQLGQAYATGAGTARDPAAALLWLKRASATSSEAMVMISELYIRGVGGPPDPKEAFNWARLSAERGDPRGAVALADCYLKGVGVAKDPRQAVQWNTRAAQAGYPAGEFALGVMYSEGIGVPRDHQKSMQWYERAAEHGSVTAMNNLAWLVATSPDPAVHNPIYGVDVAQRAVRLTGEKNSAVLDTLARAYFENRQIADAVEAEQKAVALEPNKPEYKTALARYTQILEQAKKAAGATQKRSADTPAKPKTTKPNPKPDQ